MSLRPFPSRTHLFSHHLLQLLPQGTGRAGVRADLWRPQCGPLLLTGLRYYLQTLPPPVQAQAGGLLMGRGKEGETENQNPEPTVLASPTSHSSICTQHRT